MMRGRKRPGHLVVDGLPAHKTLLVKAYVVSTNGRLTLHFLPGYAPELNPDELVWSHMKRTGVVGNPLRKGEKLLDKVEAQLAEIRRLPDLVRSFFRAPSVAYITDWLVMNRPVDRLSPRAAAVLGPCSGTGRWPLRQNNAVMFKSNSPLRSASMH